MSTSAAAAPVPSPTEIVVYEPRCDRPAAEDPWIGPAVRGPRRRGRTRLVWPLLILAASVYVMVVFPSRVGIALPATVAIACLWVVGLALATWRTGGPKCRQRLLERSFRKISLADDDLLTLRRAAFLRLAPDQWVKIRPASVLKPLFTHKPHAMVLGPDLTGRVVVVAPGILVPIIGRVTQAPPRSAEPVALLAPQPVAPKDDEVLRSGIRYAWRVRISGAVVRLTLVGWLLATYIPVLFRPYSQADELPGIAALCAVVLAAPTAQANARVLVRLGRVSRATTAAAWTPLPVTFDRAVRQGFWIQNLTGTLHLPDGRTRPVELDGVRRGLAAAMRISGVLWIAGDAGPGYRPVGLPGYPTSALAKLGRARSVDS